MDVIIFGINQFAEDLCYYLKNETKYNVCGFTVDKEYCTVNEYQGLPVVPFEEVEKIFPSFKYGIFICVGYNSMNTVREKKFKQAKEKGYQIMSFIHSTAIVLTDDIGEGNIVLEGVTIGIKCKIGCGNVFWANAHIAHHTTVGNFNFFTISVAIAGNINIKNNCFFGNNCTIKNGVKIDSYTLVGAGAYINHNTEKYGVYVPQRTVKLENKLSTEISLIN